MELSQLRYFCEVARTQHMTQSARNLHISQPALTRSIHRLEEDLNVALFERTGRRIRITPEGSRFYDRIAAAVGLVDDAVADAQSFAEDQRRTVRVNVLSASGVTVDAIAAFADERSEIAIEVVQNTDDSLCDLRIDTMNAESSTSLRAEDFAEETLFREAIGLAVPLESHYEDKVDLTSLASERFICLAGSRRFRGLCDALCAERGFVPKIGFESDNPAVVKKMVALGLGVGFWPRFSWGCLEGSGARWVPLTEEGFERVISVGLSARSSEKIPAREFYDLLVDAFTRAASLAIGGASE